MKARVKTFEIEVEPMTKFEYYDKIRKLQYQHLSNKRINGYWCNWNGYTFWMDEVNFNKIYTLENDKEI